MNAQTDIWFEILQAEKHKVLSMKSRLSCNDSKPPQSLQASACSQIQNNEHKLENRIKMLIKFWFNLFMCVFPHSCHHTQAAITADITGHLVPSVMGSHIHGFEELFGGLRPKKSLNDSDTCWNHKNQTVPWTSETHDCIRNLYVPDPGHPGQVSKTSSPAFLAFLLSGFPLHLRSLGEVFSLTHTDLQIHTIAYHENFFMTSSWTRVPEEASRR